MKGLRILGLAFVAMFAMSLIGVASASAADIEFCSLSLVAHTGLWGKRSTIFPDGCEEDLTVPEGEFELYEAEFLLALWLEGSTAVTSILPVEAEGELELDSLNAGGLKITTRVLCSRIYDGWIGPESLDGVSELLTLGGVAVPLTALTGTPLLCTNDGNCTEPEVWAVNLPWETELELFEVLGEFSIFVNLIFNGGWYAQCLILGVTASETCEAADTAVEVTNEPNGTVDETFSDTIQQEAGLKLGNCTSGGAGTTEVNGLVTVLESGVSISASSE
jgi:hypothetical protein